MFLFCFCLLFFVVFVVFYCDFLLFSLLFCFSFFIAFRFVCGRFHSYNFCSRVVVVFNFLEFFLVFFSNNKTQAKTF